MVNTIHRLKKYLPFFLLLTTLSTQAYEKKVSDLDILTSGFSDKNRNDPHEEFSCKAFTATREEVLTFFKLSKRRKDRAELLHARYSPCKISGHVRFDDGSAGEWVIQSSGIGRIIFDHSREVVYLLQKDYPWHDPYACTYGLGDEPEC